MRNLDEYPITEKEIVDALRSQADKLLDVPFDQRPFGDLTPMCLSAAVDIVEAAFDMLRGIERRFIDNPKSHMRWVTPWDKATKMIEATRRKSPTAPNTER